MTVDSTNSALVAELRTEWLDAQAALKRARDTFNELKTDEAQGALRNALANEARIRLRFRELGIGGSGCGEFVAGEGVCCGD